MLLQGIGQTDAVLVFERARFLHVEVSRAGRGTKKALAKTRAFFIRPIDETHRDRRVAAVLLVNAAQNFQAGERVETAIEPAAIRDRIDVTADQERFL